jgi:hypothetical protein
MKLLPNRSPTPSLWRISSVDVEVEFDAENNKVAAGVWAGVSCTMAPTGGRVISLTDQLGTELDGMPKFERMLKAADGEGRNATAELLKRIHAGGSRKLDPTKVQKGGSVFDTRASTPPRAQQLTKRVSRNQQLADLIVKAARETGDSVAAIHAAHIRGPAGKCTW